MIGLPVGILLSLLSTRVGRWPAGSDRVGSSSPDRC